MISEFISMIVGIVIGQDADLPRLRPVLNDFYNTLVEMLNTRVNGGGGLGGGSLMDSLSGWFKQDG